MEETMSDHFLNRPNPPHIPTAPENKPLQPDLVPEDDSVSSAVTMTIVLLIATIILFLLFGISHQPEQKTAGAPITTNGPGTAPTASAQQPRELGTTGQGTPNQVSTNRARPVPSEQDQIEQTTRP
jgi:hypothetical protein